MHLVLRYFKYIVCRIMSGHDFWYLLVEYLTAMSIQTSIQNPSFCSPTRCLPASQTVETTLINSIAQ